MEPIKTNHIHMYICGLKIGLIVVVLFYIFGEHWLDLLIMLFVGIGFVFLGDKRIIRITESDLLVSRIDGLDGEKAVNKIKRDDISKIILKFPSIQCLSTIVIKCDQKICLTVKGYEVSKLDFNQLLNALKTNKQFQVQVF